MSSEIASPPSPNRPLLRDVISSLADEGVPVRVIARATKTSGDDVYEALHKALNDGKIIELPNDDWAPGSRRLRSIHTTPVLSMSEDSLALACATVFNLTRLQSAVFMALLRRPEVTKDQLHTAIENNRRGGNDPTDPKIVDVVICHIRKRVKHLDIQVKTLWGRGYAMEPQYRDRAIALFQTHFTEEVNSDVAAA